MFNFFVFLIIPVILLEALGDNGNLEKHPIDGRISGGHNADIKDYPYMLMLFKDGVQACGAGLIAEKWALTAAHCVRGLAPSNISIRANSSLTNGGEEIAVARIIKHPNFDLDISLDSDIALLELSIPVTCIHCKIIPLGTTAPKTNDSVTIMGWGVDADGIKPNTLQVTHVPVVDRGICKQTYLPLRGNVTENMFCAGYVETGGIDSCSGDGGGPVVIDGAVVGIVSWGYICAMPGYPGVYTLVPNFVDWIRNTTGISI